MSSVAEVQRTGGTKGSAEAMIIFFSFFSFCECVCVRFFV